jgi:hypothetical protein
MNNSTFIILLTATFPTLSVSAFFFSLAAFYRVPRAVPRTAHRSDDLESALLLLIYMVEQERRRVRSLENSLGAARRHTARQEARTARSEPDHNATNNTETNRRADPSSRDTERPEGQDEEDAIPGAILEVASNVELPPSPSEQHVNNTSVLEQLQELDTVADRHRNRPNTYGPTADDIGTMAAPLTNGYHHPAPIINGDIHTTPNNQARYTQHPRQQANTIPTNTNSVPDHRLSIRTRILVQDLVDALVRILRATEPRPSETRIQTIVDDYITELREAGRRQLGSLGGEEERQNVDGPTVNGSQMNSEGVNGFHIDGGIVRNEMALNGVVTGSANTTTVNHTNLNGTLPFLRNATYQPNGMRLRADFHTTHFNRATGNWETQITHGFVDPTTRENSAQNGVNTTNNNVADLPNGIEPQARCSTADDYTIDEQADRQEALRRYYENDEHLQYPPYQPNGRGLPSSPTSFGVRTRPTYASVARLPNKENGEATGNVTWTPIARSNRVWNHTATPDDTNDTDLNELISSRNGDQQTRIYHITPPITPPLSTRSNSLSGTTLVNSVPSLSGSTLVASTSASVDGDTFVNPSADGDTPPPSTQEEQIELYRNGAYEIRLAGLRRQRAMSDIRSAARAFDIQAQGNGESVAIPIDETGRRGAVAVGHEQVVRESGWEEEWLREAEESWWGLRDRRTPRRRDSVEEEMMAHVLGRERGSENERVHGVEDDDGPRVKSVVADEKEEGEVQDEQTRDERTTHE